MELTASENVKDFRDTHFGEQDIKTLMEENIIKMLQQNLKIFLWRKKINML